VGDVDFTLRLMGSGWYLNRYDRNILEFKSRNVERDFTDFKLRSKTPGTGYLFFSYIAEDVYILVTVERRTQFEEEPVSSKKSAEAEVVAEEAITGETVQEEEVSGADAETAEAAIQVDNGTSIEITGIAGTVTQSEAEETDRQIEVKEKDQKKDIGIYAKEEQVLAPGVSENKRKYGKEKVTTGPDDNKMSKLPKDEKKPKKEKKPEKSSKYVDIYYVDEDNKKIEVPFKSENDDYYQGLKSLQKGLLNESLENFRRYLEECEKCTFMTEVNFKVADIHMTLGNNVDALEFLEKVIDTGPEDLKGKAYLLRAEIYQEAGLKEHAVDSFNRAFEYNRNDKLLLQKIGDLYYELSDYRNALNAYEEGISLGLSNDETFFKVASIYDTPGDLRNLEMAYSYYRIIIDQYRNSRHYTFSERRVLFFEKNFFNYE
jgi:tetratricopeptide (TPR) repeat protein